MKTAIKYFILYLVMVFAGAFVAMVPAIIILGITQGASVLTSGIESNQWVLSSAIFAGNLLVILFFWKMKYTRYNFNITTGEPSYDYKKLYLGAFLGCLGCLMLALLIQMVIPFPDAESVEYSLSSMMKNPLGILAVCLIGPMAEETVFRGAILRVLLEKNWKPWIAILVAALFFVVAHFNLAQGSTALIIGFFMGWVYYRTRSVWPCIFIHVLNNTTATVLELAAPSSVYEEYYQTLPLLLMFVLSLVLIYLGVLLITKLPKAIAPQPLSEVIPPVFVDESGNTTPIEGVEPGEPATPDSTVEEEI